MPLATCLLAVCLLAVFVGCTQGIDDPGREGGRELAASLPEVPAADFLRQVFARYRHTRQYSDRGEVLLRVRKGDRVERRTAPMHVCLEGASLWVAAYDARLWSDSRRTIGWVADPQTDHHDGQVVLGPASTEWAGEARGNSERPVLERLLGDPILTGRMVGGLGGPPPQLEWLLDADPMAKLFSDGETASNDSAEAAERIRYQSIVERDGVPCVVVSASDGNESYRFWIDRDRSCIKAVQLPATLGGRPVKLDGWTVESLELVLHDASFRPHGEPFELERMPKYDFPKRPRYVNALVPLPPPPPHRRLGSTLPELTVGDRRGGSSVTQRGFDRRWTLWLVGAEDEDAADEHADADGQHPAGPETLALVRALTAGLDRLPADAKASIRPVVLANDHSAATLQQAGIAAAGWVLIRDSQSELAERLGVTPGQCLLSDREGRVIWIGNVYQPVELASLPAVMTDVVAGHDVPERLRRQWQADRRAYRSKLEQVRAPAPR